MVGGHRGTRVATRVEFPGLDHGASGPTDRGGKPELVAQQLSEFFG